MSDGGVRRRLTGVLVATSMSMLEEECGICGLEKSYVNELSSFGAQCTVYSVTIWQGTSSVGAGALWLWWWLAKPVESDDSSVANGRVPGRLQWQWSGSRIEKGHYHSTLRRFRTPRSSLAGGLQH